MLLSYAVYAWLYNTEKIDSVITKIYNKMAGEISARDAAVKSFRDAHTDCLHNID